MNYITICSLISYLPVAIASPDFRWIKERSSFDCIVGISVRYWPVAIGVYIRRDTVITSANPIEPSLTRYWGNYYYDRYGQIQVHAIYDNRWKTLRIRGYYANISGRDRAWVRMGFNRRHTSIHDVIGIRVYRDSLNYNQVHHGRYPYWTQQVSLKPYTPRWMVVGFGYVNQGHVKRNTVLVMTELENRDEVDCDEWIPRAWGRFVCMLNSKNLDGIQSGAPLYQDGKLRAIGCFSLEKGKESILVFTEIKFYISS